MLSSFGCKTLIDWPYCEEGIFFCETVYSWILCIMARYYYRNILLTSAAYLTKTYIRRVKYVYISYMFILFHKHAISPVHLNRGWLFWLRTCLSILIGITNLHFTYHVKTLTTLYRNTETRKILRMAFWRGQYSLCQILTNRKGVSSIFNFLDYIHITTHILIRYPLEVVHVLNLQTIYIYHIWCFFNWSLRENIVK